MHLISLSSLAGAQSHNHQTSAAIPAVLLNQISQIRSKFLRPTAIDIT